MSKAMLPFGLPDPGSGPVDLLIVAGEHSGDEHAARVVRDLRARHPDLRLCALGGPELAAAGAQLLHDLTATSVVGFVEVLKHYPFFKALFDATLRWIERHQPRAVCFVDYPGFNLRLAAQLRERGLTVQGGGKIQALYYISPQIWAWKPKRRFKMARDLDALAVIFPFEPDCYKDTSLPVEFVGHPFLSADYVPPVRYDPAGPVLLLPGSRVQAVGRIFPALLAGFRQFGEREALVLYPSADILGVLRATNPPANVRLQPISEGRAGPLGPPKKDGRPSSLSVEALAKSDPPLPHSAPIAASAVLTSSGTMSLHCALAGIPGAIAYRTNPFTYLLARWWVKIDYIGIANLLLREPMYPEFIQGAATAQALAEQLHECTGDAARCEKTKTQAARLRELLHEPTGGTAADWLARRLGWRAGALE